MSRSAGFAIAVALFSLVAASTVKAAQKGTGSLEVTVVLDGDRSFKSGAIYLKDRIVPLRKNENKYFISDAVIGRHAVTVEAYVSQGWFKPDLRYIGVFPHVVEEGKKGEVAVSLSPAEHIDSFCHGCHPNPGEPAQPGQIVRDLHYSDRMLEDGYRRQAKKYNDLNEKKKKEGQPYNLPIKLEEREVEENGRKVKRTFITCESCHTLHLETPNSNYAVAPFRKKADLCMGCHI